MNRKMVLSTNNKNKIKELKSLLEDLPIDIISKKDIGQEDFDVIEDGDSLEVNSEKKARELSKLTNYMVLADDSGLFVDALDGQPGVYSARYAGEEGNDRKNNEKLLSLMEDLSPKERGASFKAVLTLVTEDKRVIHVQGECMGHIGLDLKGPEDFGYDPLFIPLGYNKTFAELDLEVKNRISHRGLALKKLREALKELLVGDKDEDTSNKL